MLNSFRSSSNSLVTKILVLLMLGLLIASFALWGIGDVLTGSGGGHTLAKIGPEKITVDQYRRELAIETDQVRRQLGASYSPELLKRLNVPQYVLQKMTQKSLLNQEAKRIGFIPDDTTVALEIRKNLSFLNNSGVFDKARFENALRTQGMSEKTYVENLRMQLAADKLLGALEIEPPIDDAMLGSLQAAFNQGRNITLYKLSASSLPAAKTPTEDELTAFHREHAEQFTAPEMRSVSFVRFSAKESAKPISNEAVQAYYDAHQDLFQVGEKREVEQLLYSSEEKAKEAEAQLKAGKKFSAVAKAIEPLNPKSLSLGSVEKKSIHESAAAQVFALKLDGITPPIKTPFGWNIFHVTRIDAPGMLPLDKARPAIEAALREESHESDLTDKMNQMEDALAGGSTLKEAATAMGLNFEEVSSFDKQGNGPDGKPNKQIPDLDKFIDVTFKTDEKTESSVITSKGGVYYVLRVETLSPEKLRPLAEVKSEVVKAFNEYETSRHVADLASKIDEELAKKMPAQDIIANHKLTPAATGAIYRDSKALGSAVLIPSFVTSVFSSELGTLTSPSRDKNGDYYLAQVSSVAPAIATETQDNKARKTELTQSMQEEMMMQYLRYLQIRFPVTVHQDTLEQIIQSASDASR